MAEVKIEELPPDVDAVKAEKLARGEAVGYAMQFEPGEVTPYPPIHF
jgi:hypothetical protein